MALIDMDRPFSFTVSIAQLHNKLWGGNSFSEKEKGIERTLDSHSLSQILILIYDAGTFMGAMPTDTINRDRVFTQKYADVGQMRNENQRRFIIIHRATLQDSYTCTVTGCN